MCLPRAPLRTSRLPRAISRPDPATSVNLVECRLGSNQPLMSDSFALWRVLVFVQSNAIGMPCRLQQEFGAVAIKPDLPVDRIGFARLATKLLVLFRHVRTEGANDRDCIPEQATPPTGAEPGLMQVATMRIVVRSEDRRSELGASHAPDGPGCSRGASGRNGDW